MSLKPLNAIFPHRPMNCFSAAHLTIGVVRGPERDRAPWFRPERSDMIAKSHLRAWRSRSPVSALHLRGWVFLGIGLLTCGFVSERTLAQLAAPSAPSSAIEAQVGPVCGPPIKCVAAMCEKYEGGFPQGVMTCCTTNNLLPPRPVVLVVCRQKTDGSYGYGWRILPPGRTHWTSVTVPQGHWAWIEHWGIDYTKLPEPLTLSHSAMVTLDDGTSTPRGATTTTIHTLPGFNPVSETLLHTPEVGAPWQVSRVSDGTGTTLVTFDGLGNDPLIDQTIAAQMTQTPEATQLVHRLDRGSDGTLDRVLTFVATYTLSGLDLSLRIEDEAGSLLYQKVGALSDLGSYLSLTEETDLNGDGDIDATIFEEMEHVGLDWFVNGTFDANADGLYETIENTTITRFGDFDSLQVTEAFDAGGSLLRSSNIAVVPAGPNDYLIESLVDADGDGVVEVRVLQESTFAPFLEGTDLDRLSVDDENDGIFDRTVVLVTEKLLDGDTYSEIKLADFGADGTIEASSERNIELALAGSTFRRGDANGDGITDIADAIWSLTFFFGSGSAPDCFLAGDTNDDGIYDVADAISLFSYIFLAGSPPSAPFPDCGDDPTPSSLGCDEYTACP